MIIYGIGNSKPCRNANSGYRARKARQLTMPALVPIPFIDSYALQQVRRTSSSAIIFGRCREAYERSQFNMGYDRALRYADLIYGAIRQIAER